MLDGLLTDNPILSLNYVPVQGSHRSEHLKEIYNGIDVRSDKDQSADRDGKSRQPPKQIVPFPMPHTAVTLQRKAKLLPPIGLEHPGLRSQRPARGASFQSALSIP